MERFVDVVDVATGKSERDRHRRTASTTIRRSRPTAQRWCSIAPTSRTRSISTRVPARAQSRVRAPERFDARRASTRPTSRRRSPVSYPEPSRQEAGAGDVDGVEDASIAAAEASGARLDSRIGIGSEFPRLASGQLPDVLLALPVPRAAGLRDPDARLSRQLRLQPRLVDRRAHGRRRQRHGRRGVGRGLSEDARATSIPIASACSG